MPDATPSGPRRLRRQRLLGAVVVGGLLVMLLAAAFGVWYIFFRPAGPPPLGSGPPVIPAGAVSTVAPVSSPPGAEASLAVAVASPDT